MSPSLSHSSGLGPVGSKNLSSSSTPQPSSIVLNNEELLIRGESLQTKSQTELSIYTRRRNNQGNPKSHTLATIQALKLVIRT